MLHKIHIMATKIDFRMTRQAEAEMSYSICIYAKYKKHLNVYVCIYNIYISALSNSVVTENNGPRFLQNLFACQFLAPRCQCKKEQTTEKARENSGKTVPVITFIASTFNIEWMARMDFLFEINNSISFAFQWQNVGDKSECLSTDRPTMGGVG